MKHRSKGAQKGPVSTPSGGPVFVSPEDQKRMSLDTAWVGVDAADAIAGGPPGAPVRRAGRGS
jgi:hypothetical protein